MATVTIGIDIGQKRDPTAVVVAEVGEERPPKTVYTVRFLERLPLGLPYPKMVDRITEIVQRLHSKDPKAEVRLYVDCTGVGGPVVDLLRQGVTDPLVAVTLAAGGRLTVHGQEARLGKAFLVARLQVLLQNGQIWLPKTGEAEALAQELLDFEIKVDQDGTDRYGAFKVGSHDDLVIALGLATLYDPAAMRVQYAPALYN